MTFKSCFVELLFFIFIFFGFTAEGFSAPLNCNSAPAAPAAPADRAAHQSINSLQKYAPLIRRIQLGSKLNVNRFFKIAPTEEGNRFTRALRGGRGSLGRFLDEFYRTYEETKLTALQNKELLSSLRLHGYTPKSQDARKELALLSAQNVKRILSRPQAGRYQQGTAGMEEAEAVVANLELIAWHNTHVLSKAPQASVLSSQQLMKLGLNGGLNSQEPFTREFMKSDNNVFFNVGLGPRDVTRKIYKDSEYGEFALNLDHSYARKNAWISPFIMYADELLYALVKENHWQETKHKNFTRVLRRMSEKQGIGDIRSKSDTVERLIEKDPATWNRIRNKLHRYDFTADDFERLLRNQLLISLDKLRSGDHQVFKQVLSMLRGEFLFSQLAEIERWKAEGRLNDDQGVFNNRAYEQNKKSVIAAYKSRLMSNLSLLVFEPLGMPLDYELKVPVAVPPSAFMQPSN